MRQYSLFIALILFVSIGSLSSQCTERQDFYKTIMSYVGEGPYVDVYNWNDKEISSWTLLDSNDSVFTDLNMYYSNGKIDSVSNVNPELSEPQKIHSVLWNNGNISELYNYIIDDSNSILYCRYILVHDADGNLTRITKQEYTDPSWYDTARRIFSYDQNRITEVLHEIKNAGQWENYRKYVVSYTANTIEICLKVYDSGWMNMTLYTITHNGTSITEKLKQNYDENDGTIMINRTKLEYLLNGDYTSSCNYSVWQDSLWSPEMRYTYQYDSEMRLEQLNSEVFDGTQWLESFRDMFTYLNINSVNDDVPNSVFLLTNYPNPFNPETTIRYSLNRPGEISLEIYNLKGQKVKTLINSEVSAGSHSITWKGESDYGSDVSSGVYFLRLVSGQQIETRKIVLMK